MNTEQDILWKYYDQELNQAINHEASRSAITNLILIISGVIISIITYDGKINCGDLSLALFLVIIGLFGAICNAKYYERYNFHYTRARSYRNILEEKFPNIEFSLLRDNSDNIHINKFKRIFKIRLNWLWITLNVLICLFGLFLIIKIYN